jgi:hypothetical protein
MADNPTGHAKLYWRDTLIEINSAWSKGTFLHLNDELFLKNI